jgi:hypothetical protein
MAYRLVMLAPGSYDLLLNGIAIASVVRSVRTDKGWTAELLIDVPPETRPWPFEELEHEFSDFEEVRRWLGHPEVRS